MRLGQLCRILTGLDGRKSDHVRVVINGVAFPLHQGIWTRKGVTYLIANAAPNKGDPDWNAKAY